MVEKPITRKIQVGPCLPGGEAACSPLLELSKQMGEVHTAICGNAELGHRGLVQRVRCLETAVYKIMMTLAGIGGAYWGVKEFINLMK